MFWSREPVDAGGLLSYGPSFAIMYRRVAEYVDRIARPFLQTCSAEEMMIE
jgi:hypothetical protein